MKEEVKKKGPGLTEEEFSEMQKIVTFAICDLLMFQYRIFTRYDMIYKKFHTKPKDRVAIDETPLNVALDLLLVCKVHRQWAIKKFKEISLELSDVETIVAIKTYGEWVDQRLKQFDHPKAELN